MLADRQVKPRKSEHFKRMSKNENKRFLQRARQYSTPANVPTNRHPAKPTARSADLLSIAYRNK